MADSKSDLKKQSANVLLGVDEHELIHRVTCIVLILFTLENNELLKTRRQGSRFFTGGMARDMFDFCFFAKFCCY